jgi:TolA-binding protein
MKVPNVAPSIAHRTFFMLSLAAICSFFTSCGSSTQATSSDDTFFEPVKSLDRPSTPKPAEAEKSKRQSEWITKADSLLNAIKEQERRVNALTAQLQLREATRAAAPPDSSSIVKKQLPQPSKPPSRGEQPVALMYEDALRLHKSGKYQSAINAFQELLRRGIEKDLEDNCHFWIGVSHFNLREFDLALTSLRRVIDWIGSNKKADAYLMLGQTYERLGDGQQAKSMYEALLKEFPRSELAPAARRKLKALTTAR